MKWSISDELANFLDFGTRLMHRLKTEGNELSEMEKRILRAQLTKLTIASDHLLHESKWKNRDKEVA